MGKKSSKRDLKKDEIKSLLIKFVNEGSFSSEAECNSFKSIWSSLTVREQKDIAEEVNLRCLALCDWRFIGEALDHSKEIATYAIMALIIAGMGTYQSTKNLTVSLGTAIVSGAAAGMLTFSYYQNKSKYADDQRRERLNCYYPK